MSTLARSTPRWLVIAIAPVAATLVWVAAFTPFDALLATIPMATPLAWQRAAPAARRALRWRAPLMVALAIGLALWLARQRSLRVDPPAPTVEVLLAAGYVLLCMCLLHALRALLLAIGTRRLPRMVAQALTSCVLVVVGLPLLFCSAQTHRLRVPQAPEMPRDAHCTRSDFDFPSADGTVLRGTMLSPTANANTPAARVGVVVCHGLGANRAVFFDLALLAVDCGAHALAFDFRAHGESSGHVTTLGLLEADDVAAAATELRRRTGARRIVLLGVSMGGASALLAAERAHADAVFAESSFADLRSMLSVRTDVLGPLAALAGDAIALAAYLQPGVDVDAVSPFRALAALPPTVRVVLAHAGIDTIIPVPQGIRLATARPGLELQVFPAWHGCCYHADPARYRALLCSLFDP
jgi:pimeloyl-ACP methyl ester carboxylesterase